MSDCIFCQIRDGEIPSRKVYEDEHVFAILDTSQVTLGHTLVIPKQHVRNIFDYDSDLAQKVFASIPKIAKALKNYDAQVQGLNILVNNEEIAYQSVFHSHIHLLPRYEDTKLDGFGLKWDPLNENFSNELLDRTAQRIAEVIEEE